MPMREERTRRTYDRFNKRHVESKGVMVYTGTASFHVSTSVGLGRMPWFADVPLGVALSMHVGHTMGDEFDMHVNN
jgi:hypothetical protein